MSTLRPRRSNCGNSTSPPHGASSTLWMSALLPAMIRARWAKLSRVRLVSYGAIAWATTASFATFKTAYLRFWFCRLVIAGKSIGEVLVLFDARGRCENPGLKGETWGTQKCARRRFVRAQISRITGIIMGRRPVVFWINRFRSARTFSFTIP